LAPLFTDLRDLSEAKAVHMFDPGTISHLLSTYGYWAIFFLVMLESSGIPLPGETVLVSASIYASTTHGLDIRLVVACAAAGAILGDNIGFWVGREFGQRLVTRWGPSVGLDERKQKLGQYLFLQYGGPIVFFGRFVAVLRAFAALLAGVNRLAPWRFLMFNATGGILWASVFGFGGYMLGEGIHRVAGPIGWVALAVAAIGGVALWLFFKKHEERLIAQAEAAMNRQTPAPLSVETDQPGGAHLADRR
jgi:membrane protein DedA with SNARE-associated domain